MSSTQRDQIGTLPKGTETGDPASIMVNEEEYVHHNPMTREGSPTEGPMTARPLGYVELTHVRTAATNCDFPARRSSRSNPTRAISSAPGRARETR